MRVIFIMICFLLSATVSKSDTMDSVYLSNGVLFIQGKIYNKQIYLKNKTGVNKVTHFKQWEEIENMLPSPDEKYLLIYHKSNKDPSHKLSILNLASFQIIKTVKPGYGGSLDWTKDKNILMIWGCGSPCACFRLYDVNLDIITEQCEAALQEFVSSNVIVSLPCVYAKDGLFTIWSLTDGRVIKLKNFNSEYGEYYCWDAKINNGELEVILTFDQKGDSIKLEHIPFKKEL